MAMRSVCENRHAQSTVICIYGTRMCRTHTTGIHPTVVLAIFVRSHRTWNCACGISPISLECVFACVCVNVSYLRIVCVVCGPPLQALCFFHCSRFFLVAHLILGLCPHTHDTINTSVKWLFSSEFRTHTHWVSVWKLLLGVCLFVLPISSCTLCRRLFSGLWKIKHKVWCECVCVCAFPYK